MMYTIFLPLSDSHGPEWKSPCFNGNIHSSISQNPEHESKPMKQPNFLDWSLWQYIMLFFALFKISGHMVRQNTSSNDVMWCCSDGVKKSCYVALSSHESDSDKKAKKIRTLFILGQDSQVLLWEKSEGKIIAHGCHHFCTKQWILHLFQEPSHSDSCLVNVHNSKSMRQWTYMCAWLSYNVNLYSLLWNQVYWLCIINTNIKFPRTNILLSRYINIMTVQQTNGAVPTILKDSVTFLAIIIATQPDLMLPQETHVWLPLLYTG